MSVKRSAQQAALVLAGDIGGTKTILGLFRPGRSRPVELVTESYVTRDFGRLEDIVERFLQKHPERVRVASFGIAGPVVHGCCRTTNLPWVVTEKAVQKRFGFARVRVLNDLTAMALAVPLLGGHELLALNDAKVRRDANIALIAPGTGLGTALLVWADGRHIPVASEGGHADFAPNDEDDVLLWRHLRERFGHVSIERVLSGPGSVNVYEWAKALGRRPEPEWLATRIREKGDAAPVVTQAALNEKDPLCVAAMDRFAAVLGAAAGNLALVGLAVGGVFVGGGIPPRMLPILQSGAFMRAFLNKGRMRGLLENVAVRVILNSKSALLGAAHNATMA
jgi:glucokinase